MVVMPQISSRGPVDEIELESFRVLSICNEAISRCIKILLGSRSNPGEISDTAEFSQIVRIQASSCGGTGVVCDESKSLQSSLVLGKTST